MNGILEKFNRFFRENPPGPKWTMFILFLSLLVLVNFGFEFLAPHFCGEVMRIVSAVDYFICAGFFSDVCWRCLASSERWKFLRRIGWIDLLASVPHVHILRLGKIFYVFSVIRGARSAERLFGFLFASRLSVTLLFSFLFFVSSILTAAISVLYFEHGHPGATINTAGDALWWALNLASTCGNTMCVPVTLPGRVIGGILLVVGYGLFSMNAGVLANWFSGNLARVEKKEP